MSKTDKTITEQLAELETLVAWFESDEFVVEDSLEKYKQAETLAEQIEKDLKTFKNEVTVLKQKFDKQ
jgi:exodeoxyribonuclease VII small subunit